MWGDKDMRGGIEKVLNEESPSHLSSLEIPMVGIV